MKKTLTKVFSILLTFIFIFSLVSLSSCDKPDDGGTPQVCEHRDANDDSKCDKCGEPFEDKVDIPVFVDTVSLEELYQMIDDAIPDEVTSDIRLPRGFDESLAFLTWSSSNEDVISNKGEVRRGYEDVPVTFTVEIKYIGIPFL